MRDGHIIQMREQEAKRFAAMARQLLFVDTRQQAMETVLMSAWNVLRGIVNPSWLRRKIDEEQLKLFQIHDEKIKAAQEKAKEEASKPKLSIVGANGISKLNEDGTLR